MAVIQEKLKPKFGLRLQCDSVNDILSWDNEEFRRTFYSNKILVIKGATPSVENFWRICSKLGRTMNKKEYEEGRDRHASCIVDDETVYYGLFSNKINKGLGNGAMIWHKDLSNRGDKSHAIRSLRMVQCPNKNAGATVFLDTQLAWQHVSREKKDLWNSCKVEQHSWYKPGTQLEIFPSMKIHPITGAELPRVDACGNDGWISNIIDGNNNKIGYQLVLEITAEMEKIEDAIYYHTWEEGDVIMYDNYYFLHARTDLEINDNQERLMWRINTLHDHTRKLSV